MTDTLGAVEQPSDDVPRETSGRVCELPGCEGPIPEDAHHLRVYCDEHHGRENRHKRSRWIREHQPEGTKDTPPQVVIDMGSGKRAKAKPGSKKAAAEAAELAAVEQRARQIAQVVAALVLLGGKDDQRRQSDAIDIARGTEAWASSVAKLAEYESWLRVLGAGGEMSERASAWAGFLVATAGIAVPILVRHEVIKGNMAELVETILQNGAALGADAA